MIYKRIYITDVHYFLRKGLKRRGLNKGDMKLITIEVHANYAVITFP